MRASSRTMPRSPDAPQGDGAVSFLTRTRRVIFAPCPDSYGAFTKRSASRKTVKLTKRRSDYVKPLG
jgi:hypothetical protein